MTFIDSLREPLGWSPALLVARMAQCYYTYNMKRKLTNPSRPSLREIFGENLARFRRARRMTFRELSAKSGVAHPHLCRYQQGARLPSPERIEAIAAALGVAESALFERR